MTAPAPYNRVFNFSDFQAVSPTTPLPGPEVDAELNAVKITTDQIEQALGQIQKSDGTLANGIVGINQLGPSVPIGFTVRGLWAVGINYVVGDAVSAGTAFYRANVANLSSSGNSPLVDSTTWLLIANLSVATLPVRTAQLLKALAATQVNGVKTLIIAVTADADDPTNISLHRSAFAPPGGPLATVIQSTFGWSNGQMATLFTLALAQLD